MAEISIIEANDRGIRVFVGGCIERGDGSSFRAMAHAHTMDDDPNKGWVCFRSAKRLFTPAGKPSRLLWHEIAHCLISGGHYHDATFVRMLIHLEQPIPKEDRRRLQHARVYARKRYRKHNRRG